MHNRLLKIIKAYYEEEDSALEAESLTSEQHNKAKEKAKETAISRSSLSAPIKYLLQQKFISKLPAGARLLDYGSGKGTDVQALQNMFPHLDIVAYDPNHGPTEPPKGKFNIIVCNYVLNVVSDKKIRTDIINHIYALLKNNGKAFVSVRADIEALKGMTSKGTWQGYIKLKFPVVHKTGNFVMYELTKENIEMLKNNSNPN